jgi:hypothetical protein
MTIVMGIVGGGEVVAEGSDLTRHWIVKFTLQLAAILELQILDALTSDLVYCCLDVS